MIKIEKIKKEDTKLFVQLKINNNIEQLHFSVSENVSEYLVDDRIDAIVVGFLYFSMQIGSDFYSDYPISEELLYNLEYHVIETLAKSNPRLNKIKIKSPVTQEKYQPVKSIVATGISCGVDSLFTIATHTNHNLKEFNLNSLGFFDVGSSHKGGNTILESELFEGRLKLAQNFAKHQKLNLFTIESNINKIIAKYTSYSHVVNNSYVNAACILIIQKGVLKYFYSSGYPYLDFKMLNPNNEELDSEHYDLLLMPMFSINGTNFYSGGAPFDRIEKTREILKFEPTKKFLNVCVNSVKNDSVCFKCVRTLLTIDALSKIDDYNKIFDIDFYKKHKKYYLRRMYIDAVIKKNSFYIEILPLYKKKLTINFKLWCIASIIFNKMKEFIGIKSKIIV